jgi:hypothetical protein
MGIIDIVFPFKSYWFTGFMMSVMMPVTALFFDVAVPAIFPVVEKPTLILGLTHAGERWNHSQANTPSTASLRSTHQPILSKIAWKSNHVSLRFHFNVKPVVSRAEYAYEGDGLAEAPADTDGVELAVGVITPARSTTNFDMGGNGDATYALPCPKPQITIVDPVSEICAAFGSPLFA